MSRHLLEEDVEIARYIISFCNRDAAALAASEFFASSPTPMREELATILNNIEASLKSLTVTGGRSQLRFSPRQGGLNSLTPKHPPLLSPKEYCRHPDNFGVLSKGGDPGHGFRSDGVGERVWVLGCDTRNWTISQSHTFKRQGRKSYSTFPCGYKLRG